MRKVQVMRCRTVSYTHLDVYKRQVPADMIREILDADDMEKAFFAQWVLREAYIKWTGEGLSRDLRTISMDKGNYIMLELEPGYSEMCIRDRYSTGCYQTGNC